MSVRSIARAGALACAAALFVSACGGGSSKSASIKASAGGTGTSIGGASSATIAGGGSTGSSSIASDAACKVITQSDATTLFGTPATQQADSVPVSLAKSTCLWNAKPADGTLYLLQIRIYDRLAFYSDKLPGFTALPGMGDKAVVREGSTGTDVMINYVKNGNVVNIDYSVHAIAKTGLAVAKKDQLIALVKNAANS